MNTRIAARGWITRTGFLFILIFMNQVFADGDCGYERNRESISSLLTQAVIENCPELMEAILKKENSNDIFNATQSFIIQTVEKLSTQVFLLKGIDEDNPASIVFESKAKILSKAGDFLREKCPTDNKDNDACGARKVFEEQTNRLKEKLQALAADEEAERKAKEHAISPKGLIESACACDKFIAIYQSEINRQKEIGRISGTVNMLILNNAGTRIVDLKVMKKDAAQKYKNLTKKELKKYKCPNVEDLENPLLKGTEIRGVY